VKRKVSPFLVGSVVNILFSPVFHFSEKPILTALRRMAQVPEDLEIGYHELIPLTDKGIEFDGDKCIGCGLCTRVCPVHNIELVEKKPAWSHHCEMCFACDEWCPQRAIHHWGKFKGRNYHHPDVTTRDMMRQNGRAN
jgi:ferredoxin